MHARFLRDFLTQNLTIKKYAEKAIILKMAAKFRSISAKLVYL